MIVDNGKYYIYRHIRLDKNEPFYIGIGTKRAKVNSNRISAYGRAFIKYGRNDIWRKIISKTAYEVEILLESDNREFILEKEKEFVNLYGRIDIQYGCLTNLVDGGGIGFNMSKYSINKRIKTKTQRGNLSNAKNLIDWKNSPDYKNPKARTLFVYLIDGNFIGKFKSLKSFADRIGLKGSVSHLIKRANDNNPYQNKYILSWFYNGDKINVSDINLKKRYCKPVLKICPITMSVLGRYDKMTDAAKSNNVNLKLISEAVIEKSRCKGYFWIHESELNIISEIKFANNRISKH